MKKFNKILLILSLVLCLAGVVLCVGGAWAGGIDDAQEMAGTHTRTYDQEKTPLDAFSAIDADLSIANLSIRPSADDRAYLEYHIDAPVDTTPLTIAVQNGTLTFHDWYDGTDGMSNILNIFLGLLPDHEKRSIDESSIVLYLPAQTLERCTIALDMGTLDISDLSANHFIADLAMGDLSLHHTTLGQSDINLDMGSLSGDALVFNGDATIDLDMGNAELALAPESSSGLLIDANTNMGDITASESLGGNLLDTDDVMANHYRRTPQGTLSGSLTISADMGEIIFR